MAKHCTHCGQELPRDDAQFCSRCGMLVSSEPSHPQTLAENPGVAKSGLRRAPVTPIPEIRGEQRPGLREQIAQQPISRSSSNPPVSPAPGNSLASEHSSPSLSEYPPLPPTSEAQARSAPEEGTLRTVHPRPSLHHPIAPSDPSPDAPVMGNQPAPLAPDSAAVLPPSALTPPSNARELRTKVWKADGTEAQDVAIEDLPTEGMLSVPMAEIAESLPTQKRTPQRSVSHKSPISEPGFSAIEDVPTRSMPLTPAQRDVLSDMPGQKVTPLPSHIEEITRADTAMLSSKVADTPLVQTASPVSPIPATRDTQVPLTPRPPRAKRPRSSLLALLLLIVVLLAVGSVWIVVVRPFSVPEVTQPWQQFRDPSAGVAMQYPAGWPAVSRGNGTISLHDSSNTSMVTISTMAATGSDPTHALQQQATKLGMTGVKTLASLSFAGVNWQREQGSVQITGATYTVTLLAGAHSKNIYTMGQFAAQNVYGDYEQAIFAPMRASFRFL